MIYTLYLLSLIISAVVATALALYLWRRRSTPGATPAIWLMLAVVVWSLGYVLQFKSTELSGQIFATNIQYLGIVTLPVMWFVFSLEYTGHDKWLTRRNLFLLAIFPFVTVVLAWTNSFHSLMWHGRHLGTTGPFIVIAKTYGLWFWVHTSYSYLLMLFGMFILIQRLFRPPRLYRGQSITLLICVIVPLVWNVLYIFQLSPIYRLDLTPSAFTISGLAMAFGLFRFRLLDIVPVARDAMIEGMSDGVIVLDTQNRLVDLNAAAEHIVGYTTVEAIGQPVDYILSGQPELVEHMCGVREAQVEVVVEKGETQRYYESHLSQLYDRRGRLAGRLVILYNITERKRAEEKLLAYQKELRSLASQLSLAEERERRRIATEVHDRISQNLAICRMKLGSLVEAARSTRFAKPLSEMQTLIKRLIDEIRSLTFEVSSPLLYELGLEAAVERLTEQIGEEHGVKFNFEDDGQPKPLDDDIRVLLFQAVRELLINITKHAQARHARVRMERHDGDLRITVLDDGVGFDTSQISPGSKKIKGFGLFSIRERLRHIDGHIDIESKQGQGTRVTLTTPLKQT